MKRLVALLILGLFFIFLTTLKKDREIIVPLKPNLPKEMRDGSWYWINHADGSITECMEMDIYGGKWTEGTCRPISGKATYILSFNGLSCMFGGEAVGCIIEGQSVEVSGGKLRDLNAWVEISEDMKILNRPPCWEGLDCELYENNW